MAYNVKPLEDYSEGKVPFIKVTNVSATLKKKILKEIDGGEFDSMAAFFRTLAKRYFKEKDEKSGKHN